MSYQVKMMNSENLTLTDSQGEHLKRVLMSSTTPRYIEIGKNLIAINQITGVMFDNEPEVSDYLRLKEVPLTSEQLAQRQETINKMREKLSWTLNNAKK